VQQFYTEGDQVVLRTKEEHGWPPHHRLIQSPYDPQARTRTKRETRWTGYAVHLTETCTPDQPRLITHCETTAATTADGQMTAVIHQALADKALLPEEHLVDTAYVDAGLIISSQQTYDLDLVGPVPPNSSWQARDKQAYDLTCFAIDWEQKVVTCPRGHHSQTWVPHLSDHGTPVITATFKRSNCKACPVRSRCTKSQSNPRRSLTFRHQAQFLALQTARQRQDTPAFKALYQQRAGVEGTISQAVRRCALRRSRYIGLLKTRLQHLATASAMNLARVAAWLRDGPSSSRSWTSRFLALKHLFLAGAT
jgi:transposase